MRASVIVTGGAGFIGSHVADAFIAAGFEAVVVDNLSNGRLENIPPSARFYRADVRNAAALERIFARERPALVSHQAALVDVRQSLACPDAYASVNILGTLRVLDAARRHGVRKVIFASTGGAIYGEAGQRPTPEDAEARPLDFYGLSKLAGEHYVRGYQQHFGLDYCILRYANVYGPRQRAEGEAGVVAVFAHRVLRGLPVTINGDGGQTRDFVYVEDVARANLLAAQRGSGIYNVGSGAATSIQALFDQLARLAGYNLPANYGPPKPGEVRHSCLDASRAERELGWRADTALAEGLLRTLRSFDA
jgi:UDP-glucose 4-epimerase